MLVYSYEHIWRPWVHVWTAPTSVLGFYTVVNILPPHHFPTSPFPPPLFLNILLVSISLPRGVWDYSPWAEGWGVRLHLEYHVQFGVPGFRKDRDGSKFRSRWPGRWGNWRRFHRKLSWKNCPWERPFLPPLGAVWRGGAVRWPVCEAQHYRCLYDLTQVTFLGFHFLMHKKEGMGLDDCHASQFRFL